MLVFAGLSPHPPLIIPEIGKEELSEVKSTVEAMNRWACSALAARPETLVIISPHGILLKKAMGFLGKERLIGDFAAFGVPEVRIEMLNDLELAGTITERAAAEGLEVAAIDENEIDHGTLVPLYYLQEAGLKARLLSFGISYLPFTELYMFGQVLGRVLEEYPKRIGLIASGDLSHRLIPSAPAGYDPKGKVFDEIVQKSLRDRDAQRLLNLPESLIERAGECGLRPIIILLGALHGRCSETKIYSYEGPFGVGYLVAEIFLKQEQEENITDHVRLARASLDYYLKHNKLMPLPKPLPEGMAEKAGVFVSLKKNGSLRGCIGTIEPVQENMAEEIIHNAVSAGLDDPRFWPVEPEELPELNISVDVLTAPEPVGNPRELDPKKYGIIVSSKGRKGVLLPDIDEITTVEEQIHIAMMKAGIKPDEPVIIERFQVIRYKEGSKK